MRRYRTHVRLRLWRRRCVSFLALGLMAIEALAAPAHAAIKATITVFPVPTGGSGPLRITRGPDGNLWLTEYNANQIGRITPTGDITEFAIPTPNSGPYGITGGTDGNVWFTESRTEKVGRITTAGVITEYDVTEYCYEGCYPWNMTVGPDSNMWFTQIGGPEGADGWIGRITPSAVITQWYAYSPADITTGPDGKLWFTGIGYHSALIGNITTDGTVTYFSNYSCFLEEECAPVGITSGKDGALWFTTQYLSHAVVRITTTGTFTNTYAIPNDGGFIKSGPGDNLWFAQSGLSGLARMTLAGVYTGFAPLPGGPPTDLTVGPDWSSLWVTSSDGNAIVRIVPS